MKKIYFLLLTLLISSLSYSQVLITEIADPDNNADARYIELYNMGASAVDFTEGNGWQIDKYLNAASGVNATLDLTGTIPAGGFYIIAYDNVAGTFQSVYGFAPDQLDNVSNGVVGSNGDDDLALVNGSDVIVDFFGVYDFGTATNTDNTGTCAEYEDGRAERLTTVAGPSATFNEAEWNVWADSTVTGCTSHQNAPRNAPGDFDPGAWGTATCGFSMFNITSVCDAFTTGTDTYSVSIDFSGGGTSTYTVSSTSGTLGGDNPTTMETGTITVTGVSEGTDVTVNVTDGGLCDVDSIVTSPTCEVTTPLPLYENFDYGASVGDLTAVSGGNWVAHSGTGAVLYNPTSLSMSGYQSSGIGGSVTVDGSLGEDVNREFTEQTSGPVYFSALVNISAATTGNYFFHLKDGGSLFRGRVTAKDDGSGNILFGIATSTTTYVYGTTPFNLNTTYLVVASYNIDSGVSNLYVMTTPSATEPATPEATDTGATGTAISSVALRQSGGIPTAVVDGINVATSWASALSTDEFNSPNSFKIYPNPTSVGYVTISANNTEAMSVTVFDVLGKQVLNQTVSNNRLNVSTLKTGIYIMKISQNNTSVTKKLIIK